MILRLLGCDEVVVWGGGCWEGFGGGDCEVDIVVEVVFFFLFF